MLYGFWIGKGNDNKLLNKNRNFSFIKEKDLLVNIIDVSLVIIYMLFLKYFGWGVVIFFGCCIVRVLFILRFNIDDLGLWFFMIFSKKSLFLI